MWSISQGDCGLAGVAEARPGKGGSSALAKKDYRFLAVAEYAVTVPGMDDVCFVDPAQSRVMPGTTDSLCNAEHNDLINRAYTFAGKYNSYLKVSHYRNGGIRCIQ